jgi:hypothetical protein
VLDALSRELCLVVDGAGRVTWADARAARLGLSPGEALAARCVPGCEEKAAELCRRGALDVVRGWELVGSTVPQDYADAVAEAARAFHEIVELNRELARRKLRLDESNQGIRQLHEELAQQADRLRSSNEAKGRLVVSRTSWSGSSSRSPRRRASASRARSGRT